MYSILLGCILFGIPSIAVLYVLFYLVYNKIFFRRCVSKASLKGKTVIVTGASAGIGKEAARDFARRGAKTILACRNLNKAQKIADDIKATTESQKVYVMQLNTASLESVRSFAKEVLKKEERLDILSTNAGIIGLTKREVTDDGLEVTMATNHFGHFLLVNLLLGLLEKTPESRLVVTSSDSHLDATRIDPKDLNFERNDYGPLKGYALSKLCNVMMTKYLASYYQDKGLMVNCFCPGLVTTEIFEKTDSFFGNFYGILARFTGRTCEEGAQTLIHLAVSEDVNVSGRFFIDCSERPVSKLAEDEGLVKKVWEASEDAVKLSPQERMKE